MIGRIACVALAAALLAVAPAQAGVFKGSFGPANSLSTCVAGWTVVQSVGASNYQTTAGVVTKWFTRAPSGAGQQMRLVILRGTYPDYTVVGQSEVENLAPSAVNSFATRIPVAAMDHLAVTTSGTGGPCMYVPGNSDSVHYCIDCNSGPGTTFEEDGFAFEGDRRVNVFAYIEADADGDGWGDESQDNCEALSNPSQTNTDGDGTGDDCDVDDDSDSVADADDAFPLDDRESRDFDGDGQGDNADADDDNDGISDRDEALAGSNPRDAQSGPRLGPLAPTPAAAGVPAEGARPALSIEAPATNTRKKLRKGLAAMATTEAPAQLDFELRATPRGARLARFELLLASRSLGVGSGQRSVRLRPRRLPGGARRLTLQLRVVATDAGGNRAVKTRTIRVR
jgi:Bacterial TSP3 repeat